jgi:membrane protein required for colicin V production
MHLADGVILAVIAGSMLRGFSWGFVRELLSLAGWFAAYIVAQTFHAPLESVLADYIAEPSLRVAAAWTGLLVATLLLASIIGYMVRRLMEATGTSSIDRILGAVFGLLRGLIMVLALLVILAPFVSRDPWWQDALLPKMFIRYEPLGRALEDKVIKAAEAARDAASNAEASSSIPSNNAPSSRSARHDGHAQ